MISMSLKQISEKIKSFLQQYIILLIFILLANLSFSLGKVSIILSETKKIQVVAYSTPSFKVFEEGRETGSGTVAASKNGTKYYYLNCSGLKRIKESNLVYFDDFGAAERAGYDLAKNCKK